MKKSRFKKTVIILLILFFAFGLRFYQLDKVPVGLFGDELDIGYQAYSLWKTGKDYFGNSFPLYFQSFYEFRMALLVYLTAPIVGLFGLSEWTVRLLPASFGVLNIFLLWLLVKKTGNNFLATMAALALAVNPWHVHYSRAAFDVTLMASLLLAATIFYLKSLKTSRWLPFSAILFGLSFYAYSTSIVFVVFFLPALIFFTKKQIVKTKKKTVSFSLITFAVVCMPLAISMVSGKASSRFSGINITSDPQIVDQIVFKRSQDNGEGRIYHNKLVSYSKVFLANYLTSFSPQFLFISGDLNPRHSPVGFGQLYYIFLPFLFIGIFKAVKSKDLFSKLFLSWLVLSPIPSSLTVDGAAHATRLFLMLPPLAFFVSLGVVNVLDSLKGKVKFAFVLLVIIITSLEMSLFLHDYFRHYPRESWEYFNFGHKQIFQKLGNQRNDYNQVYVNARHDPPLISFLFWGKIDPGWFQENYQGQDWKDNITVGFDGFTLDKYYFGEVKPNGVLDLLNNKVLYVAFQNDEIPGDWNWQISPPKGAKTLEMVKEPIGNQPYMYLLTGDEN
jgi:4-amino-4-deoxy-L-arabinose transferase-like glycosyltransferase